MTPCGIFNPADEPKEHREFFFEPVFVNTANAAQIKADYIEGIPNYDWDDLWGRVQEG
jgi:ribose transport system substrate-binding protein